jgi:glycosyltransferase involved in cell wall biosynthesis
LRILIAIGVPRQKEAGAAGVALNHARELEKLGHSVECWFLDDVFKKPVKLKRFEAFAFSLAIAKRIRINPDKFDVANIHAPWGCVYGLQRKMFFSDRTPPYVLTMQGSEERFVEAMRRENQKGNATNFGWKNRLWHRIYHQTMYDIAIRTADYGAVANREAWILAELKYRRKSGEFWYVPNGTEESFFCDRQYPEKLSMKLLYVGTWIDRKGVSYLADAFRLVCEKNPNVELTVAGCSVSQEKVRNSFSPAIREKIAVIPFVDRREMPAIYASHDVFVFSSLVEGMPLTLLEAMASGMPVVTTNNSGMADIVEDEFNGLLVESANAQELAKAIEVLLDSSDLRKQVGQAAQSTAKRYTWKEVVRKMDKVLLLPFANKN